MFAQVLYNTGARSTSEINSLMLRTSLSAVLFWGLIVQLEFLWLFPKCGLCTPLRQIFPQVSTLWIHLMSEGMNVTWGKTELISVCTNGVLACRNRWCCPSKIIGNWEMYIITTGVIRDPCGCLWIYLAEKEEERKEIRVRKQMRRLWWDHLMSQGTELLTADVYQSQETTPKWCNVWSMLAVMQLIKLDQIASGHWGFVFSHQQ